MEEIHKNLKAVFVTTRVPKDQSEHILRIEKILENFGVEMLLKSNAAHQIGKIGFDTDEILKRTNLIISLGGDGNFIGTCREFASSGAYIFGVHTGHLGFLTDATINEFEGFFGEFLQGKYKVEKQALLQAQFEKNGVKTSEFGFNDVVLVRKKVKSTACINAFLNNKHFNTYFGDGVIVSSAMGSTAYNMSAGGAIIYPLCKVFSLTPICSHSLTQRPLVLPSEFRVEFRSSDDISVIIDGQNDADLKDYDRVVVGFSDIEANIIRHVNRDYFDILKQKLRWGH